MAVAASSQPLWLVTIMKGFDKSKTGSTIPRCITH